MEGMTHPNCRCVPSMDPLKMGWGWLRTQKAAIQNAILGKPVAVRMRAGDLTQEQIVDGANHRRRSLRNIFGEADKKVLMRRARRRRVGRQVYRRAKYKGVTEEWGDEVETAYASIYPTGIPEQFYRQHGQTKPKLRVLFAEGYPNNDQDTVRASVEDVTDFMWDWTDAEGENSPGNNWSGHVTINKAHGHVAGLKTPDCKIHLFGNFPVAPSIGAPHWSGVQSLMHEFLHAASPPHDTGAYGIYPFLEEGPVEMLSRQAFMDWLDADPVRRFLAEGEFEFTGYRQEMKNFEFLMDVIGIEDQDDFVRDLYMFPHPQRYLAGVIAIADRYPEGDKRDWLTEQFEHWAEDGSMLVPFNQWKEERALKLSMLEEDEGVLE
jgi:hypothetical protein